MTEQDIKVNNLTDSQVGNQLIGQNKFSNSLRLNKSILINDNTFSDNSTLLSSYSTEDSQQKYFVASQNHEKQFLIPHVPTKKLKLNSSVGKNINFHPVFEATQDLKPSLDQPLKTIEPPQQNKIKQYPIESAKIMKKENSPSLILVNNQNQNLVIDRECKQSSQIQNQELQAADIARRYFFQIIQVEKERISKISELNINKLNEEQSILKNEYLILENLMVKTTSFTQKQPLSIQMNEILSRIEQFSCRINEETKKQSSFDDCLSQLLSPSIFTEMGITFGDSILTSEKIDTNSHLTLEKEKIKDKNEERSLSQDILATLQYPIQFHQKERKYFSQNLNFQSNLDQFEKEQLFNGNPDPSNSQQECTSIKFPKYTDQLSTHQQNQIIPLSFNSEPYLTKKNTEDSREFPSHVPHLSQIIQNQIPGQNWAYLKPLSEFVPNRVLKDYYNSSEISSAMNTNLQQKSIEHYSTFQQKNGISAFSNFVMPYGQYQNSQNMGINLNPTSFIKRQHLTENNQQINYFQVGMDSYLEQNQMDQIKENSQHLNGTKQKNNHLFQFQCQTHVQQKYEEKESNELKDANLSDHDSNKISGKPCSMQEQDIQTKISKQSPSQEFSGSEFNPSIRFRKNDMDKSLNDESKNQDYEKRIQFHNQLKVFMLQGSKAILEQMKNDSELVKSWYGPNKPNIDHHQSYVEEYKNRFTRSDISSFLSEFQSVSINELRDILLQKDEKMRLRSQRKFVVIASIIKTFEKGKIIQQIIGDDPTFFEQSSLNLTNFLISNPDRLHLINKQIDIINQFNRVNRIVILRYYLFSFPQIACKKKANKKDQLYSKNFVLSLISNPLLIQ